MMIDALHAPTSYSPARFDEARALVAKLNAEEEDGWAYWMVYDRNKPGWTSIEVQDEDGAVVGRL